VATLTTGMNNSSATATRKGKFAYTCLLLLSVLYFARPEDFIPGLGLIPVAKIAGGLAFLALIFSLLSGGGKIKIPFENKLLLGLLFWLLLTVPFAYWRGGALGTITDRFVKGVIAAFLVSLLIKDWKQLKRLLWIQAASVSFMTIVSIFLHLGEGGRMGGVLGGVFQNPNDLAINIALNWPLCLAFLMAARGPIKKMLWAVGLLAMMYGVMRTYSRSGFLALIAAIMLCLWEFGVRGRRFHLLFAAGILGMAALIAAPHNYSARIISIFEDDRVAGSGDRGSREARRELLDKSLEMAFQHPLLGVGPGNFEVLGGTWQVAHNTFTELAAEGGFPALILFLWILQRAFVNLKAVRKSELHQQDKEIRLFTSGLWVSVPAYMIGAFFSSTEYSMYPYFVVAYTSALYYIACLAPKAQGEAFAPKPVRPAERLERVYAKV
jgi:putative inorganic carbon (hco3(-)) transporter